MSGETGLPRRLRGSTAAVLLFGLLGFVGAGLVVAATHGDPGPRRARTAELVAALALSDLGLFTEARYTRNPSLADLHSPFQDGPASLEHFPTASLIVAPRTFPAGRIDTRKD